jgi:hypothetical protein
MAEIDTTGICKRAEREDMAIIDARDQDPEPPKGGQLDRMLARMERGQYFGRLEANKNIRDLIAIILEFRDAGETLVETMELYVNGEFDTKTFGHMITQGREIFTETKL